MIPHSSPPRMGASAELGLCPVPLLSWIDQSEQIGDESTSSERAYALEHYGTISSEPFFDYYSAESSDCADVKWGPKITGYDCKLPGCDTECERNHDNDYMYPSSPTHDMQCVETSEIFGFSIKPSSNSSNTDCPILTDDIPDNIPLNVEQPKEEPSECDSSEIITNFQPYTPDNDHCYYQPMHLQTVPEESSRESVDSESQSDSSDDEVDVVTVTDEYFPSETYRRAEMQRRAGCRQQRYTKKQLCLRNKLSESTVKAAATALKRTASRFPVQSSAKRRRKTNSVETSPSSSLPSSCVSSRCSSDVEDFEKRNTHNDSERKRREAQRTALQDLRTCIPELQENIKAPKVLILTTATKLVKQLNLDVKTSASVKKHLIRFNQELKAKRKDLVNYFNSLSRL